MTTRIRDYLDAIYAKLRANPDFPGELEPSTTAIFEADTPATLTLFLDREEVVEGGPIGVADRVRTVGAVVHAAGVSAQDDAEAIFEALQPVVMRFQADGLVNIREIGTTAPKFPKEAQDRFQVTRYFQFTYRTADDSLSG